MKPIKSTVENAYLLMQQIRQFETQIRQAFYNNQVPGLIHTYDGQEAIAAGVCLALEAGDTIASTHRCHGHAIAKGCELQAVAAEVLGKSTGVCGGKGGTMHIADFSKGMLGANAIVGGAAPIALGAALSAKTLKQTHVAIAFAGDGASNHGSTLEAMNFAVALKLPIIFVIENNGYGEGTPIELATGGTDLNQRTRGFGIPTDTIDGTDFYAVYELTQKALAHCRKGLGPYAIEAKAKRFEGHFVGDPMQYRPKGEVRELKKTHDCLKQFAAHSTTLSQLDIKALKEIADQAKTQVSVAIEEALTAPAPDAHALYENVYAD